jgi:hypothetical protein
MYAEHASSPKADAKRLFLQRISYDRQSQFNTKRIGGAERDRTADPLLAKQVLSQLSYSPNHSSVNPKVYRDKHPSGKTLWDQHKPSRRLHGCAMHSPKAKHGGPG